MESNVCSKDGGSLALLGTTDAEFVNGTMILNNLAQPTAAEFVGWHALWFGKAYCLQDCDEHSLQMTEVGLKRISKHGGKVSPHCFLFILDFFLLRKRPFLLFSFFLFFCSSVLLFFCSFFFFLFSSFFFLLLTSFFFLLLTLLTSFLSFFFLLPSSSSSSELDSGRLRHSGHGNEHKVD